MKQELKEIVLENEGRKKKRVSVGGWYMSGGIDAYTIAFVYSKRDGNFIVKGFRTEVENYLNENHTHWFANFTYWNSGKCWNVWKFWKDSWGICEPSKILKEHKFTLFKYNKNFFSNEQTKRYKFKRMPNRWIPLMDKCN